MSIWFDSYAVEIPGRSFIWWLSSELKRIS